MKKNLTNLLSATVTFIALTAFTACSGDKDSINPDLVKAANEINKNCPINIDAETRLDNSMAMPGNTFAYNYTLLNFDRSQLDTANLQQLLMPNMKNTIKTSPEMNSMRAIDCTFLYTYKDKTGAYAFSIRITPEDYK